MMEKNKPMKNNVGTSILSKIGKVPLCNGKPERAPHLGSFCFPLCWRCTSIIIGIALLNWIELSFFYSHITMGMLLSFMLLIPCIIDGLKQNFQNYESTNKRRIITGILAGCGFNVFCATLYGLLSCPGRWSII